jgi:hypothetical protein
MGAEVSVSTGRDEDGPDRREAGQARWTVGADGLATRLWSGEPVQMPTGRLHAVDVEGLLHGHSVCQAPVVLLDPVDWRWPDDGSEEWPLCWICADLTR